MGRLFSCSKSGLGRKGLQKEVSAVAALTDKQRRFADEYIANKGNATQAAIVAGYSRKTARKIGCENLTKPAIQDYIKERTAAIEEDLVAKGDEVLKFLSAVMRGEMEETYFNKIGQQVGYVSQKNQIKAAEILAKCHGLTIHKVEVEVSADIAAAKEDIASAILSRKQNHG